jgi:hypothetical protein
MLFFFLSRFVRFNMGIIKKAKVYAEFESVGTGVKKSPIKAIGRKLLHKSKTPFFCHFFVDTVCNYINDHGGTKLPYTLLTFSKSVIQSPLCFPSPFSVSHHTFCFSLRTSSLPPSCNLSILSIFPEGPKVILHNLKRAK